MLEKIEMTIEEVRACLFFMTVWQYIGEGPALREKTLEILSADKMEFVPNSIREEFADRLKDSIVNNNFEWIDRAVPGYRVTLRNILE